MSNIENPIETWLFIGYSFFKGKSTHIFVQIDEEENEIGNKLHFTLGKKTFVVGGIHFVPVRREENDKLTIFHGQIKFIRLLKNQERKLELSADHAIYQREIAEARYEAKAKKEMKLPCDWELLISMAKKVRRSERDYFERAIMKRFWDEVGY